MADTPEYAAGPDPFEAAVADLAARLRELGATPREATQAAVQTVAGQSITRPSPMQPPDRTGVRAGQRGLPPMPEFSRNALAGPEMRSTNTPMGDVLGAYDTGLGALASKAERGAGNVLRGAAEFTGIPQAVRAGDALGDALNEPSLANVTNAGTQSALAIGKPLAAAATLGAGYLTAGAKDLGLFDMSANAQQPKAQGKTRPGLTPELNAEYDALDTKIKNSAFVSRADAIESRNRLKQLQDITNNSVVEGNKGRQTAETDAALKRQAEYDRAVQGADSRLAEDKQRAKDQNFYETEVGKLYKKTGVVTPGVAAFGVGALTRLAGGGTPAALGWGGATGGMAANYPLLHNTYYQDAYNPEKAAYAAYARDLPPEHPRKAEWDVYAKNLPDQNPAQKIASEQMWDPAQFAMRTGLGVAEGMLGGHLGNSAMDIPITAFKNAGTGIADGYELLRSSRRGGPLQTEAASLERNALAGPPEAASATAATRPAAAATDVPLNPLGTGLMPMRGRGQAGMSDQGPSLGSEALSNRSPSEILGSIQRAPREVPTTFPQSTPAANPAPARPAGMPEWASEPPQGVKLSRGQWWDAKQNQPRNADGTLAEMPKYKASRPKAEKQPQRSDAIPEKPSIQVDDMAPYGRGRSAE